MKKILFFLFLLFISINASQDPNIKIDFTVTDDGDVINELHSQIVSFGLDAAATNGIDTLFGESLAPPFAPSGLEARLVLTTNGTSFPTNNNNTWKDYRGASFPFTGTTIHRLVLQSSTNAANYTLHFNSFALPGSGSFSVRIQDIITGSLFNQIISSAGNVIVPVAYAPLKITVTYTNVNPPAPGPLFQMSPASLTFSTTAIGNSRTLPVRIKNTGATNALTITNITSSNAQFTFTPNTFPITVSANDSQLVNVTFAPTSAGTKSANLIFTHNAAGSPDTLTASGQGTSAFSISPAEPLNLPAAALGSNSTATVTVTNVGSNSFSITNVTSSDPQFTISPTTATISSGGHQDFTITFTPTASGSQTATLSFTHSAAGSPVSYSVQGIGQAPVFYISADSLTFSPVSIGGNATLPLTVTNNGQALLSITNASSSDAQFTVTPSTASISAGNSQIFTVRFTPASSGSQSAALTFTHNAAGSPSTVTLSGSGSSVFGLLFGSKDSTSRMEDSTYTDIIQLKNPAGNVHALQFVIKVNKTAGDYSAIKLDTIVKGRDVSRAAWSLQYEIFRGPHTSYGSSVDSVRVLLYNLNQGEGLTAGASYDSLLKVNYTVINLPGTSDSVKSSFRITNAEASTYQGNAINITPSRSEFKVWITNRVQNYGDINDDGSIDVSDILILVDYILGRTTLTSAEFMRANIAPWPAGDTAPSPDSVVNVQDLSVIQNIILTNHLPSGTRLNKMLASLFNDNLAKTSSKPDTKVTLYIKKDGITIHLNTKVAIRGAQLELGNVNDNVSNMVIDTKLGNGFFAKVDAKLRVLLYDMKGNDIIESGESYLAALPFSISSPRAITVDKIILADLNKQKVENIEQEIIYSESSITPTNYALYQNYPNPFNPTTTISFALPKADNVIISIFNVLGQEIKTFMLGQIDEGTHTLVWDGKDNSGIDASTGMYIYKMNTSNFSQSRKMMLLK